MNNFMGYWPLQPCCSFATKFDGSYNGALKNDAKHTGVPRVKKKKKSFKCLSNWKKLVTVGDFNQER